MPKRECAYHGQPAGSIDWPECDDGGVTHRKPNYFPKATKGHERHGPHLYLCSTHAEWLGAASPFGGRIEAVR